MIIIIITINLLNIYLKENYKIILLNINEINNDYNEIELKESIENNFYDYQIIWI